MNDGRKRIKNLSETCVQFYFPFCGPAAHNDLKLRTEYCKLVKSHLQILYVCLQGRSKDCCDV